MFQSIAIIVLLFRFTQTQDANCDFNQNVIAGRTYYIYTPNYPSNYKPGSQCRWIATCPSGYNCRVDCNVNIPQTPSCSGDRFLISKTGDPQLTSAEYYCGYGTITAVSTGRTISLGFISSRNSKGGKIVCQLTAQKANNSPSCNCGYRKTNRIVGGEKTEPYEYTMMAAIRYYPDTMISCGAVIISKNYVLTAAHCITKKPLSEIEVVVGEYDTTNEGDAPPKQTFKAISLMIHPQYNEANEDNDIAIIRLNKEINFDEYVGPVCLPFKFVNSDFTGTKVTMLGWGTTSIGAPLSKVLRKVDVDVISQSSCQSRVQDLTSRQICTYSRGKDSCQNDSGGPVLYTDAATGKLYNVGIISYGMSCASDSPGVNTRVTSFLNWIERNAPADYCKQ